MAIKNSSARICCVMRNMTGVEPIITPFRKMTDFRDKYEYSEGGITLSWKTHVLVFPFHFNVGRIGVLAAVSKLTCCKQDYELMKMSMFNDFFDFCLESL